VPRYSAGARATGAGSTTLPTQSLYAVAAISPKLRLVGVFNTTTTACVYELVTLTTAGTQGAGLTEGSWAPDQNTPQCTVFQAHSGVAPTIGQRLGILFPLGAAVGSGLVLPFDDLRVDKGTANGYGLIAAGGGTGQLCDIFWIWDE